MFTYYLSVRCVARTALTIIPAMTGLFVAVNAGTTTKATVVTVKKQKRRSEVGGFTI